MGRFKTEKIIKTEDEAVEVSSLYILPIDENTFRLIITDDHGGKRVNSVLTGNTNFIQLADAPITYTDNAGKVIVVKSSEDGLEFQELESLSATIEVGQVTSVPSNEPPQVTNVGTDKDAIFNFEIPVGIDGEAATIGIGTVTTLNPEQNVVVTNVGTPKEAVLNFGIPKGEPGIKGDTGDLSVINFTIDDELHLIMELQTNTNLNFTLDNNGHLIIIN